MQEIARDFDVSPYYNVYKAIFFFFLIHVYCDFIVNTVNFSAFMKFLSNFAYHTLFFYKSIIIMATVLYNT